MRLTALLFPVAVGLSLWGIIYGVAALATAPRIDHGQCLQSHQEFSVVPIFIPGPNGVLMTQFIPQWHTECDRWEYPNGRE